jgi:hypothetical protein
MNLKVANLIAVQSGLLIGAMSWLAYSRLESAAPRSAETHKRTVAPVATVASVSEPRNPLPSTVDDSADRDEAQPIVEQAAPAMSQYSPAAVQRYSDLAAQQYYQQIAPRRYASAGLQNGPVVAEAPSSTEVDQAPAVAADYAEPQTVAYYQPNQIVVYPQPQFVIFSNSRRFANRCRPAPPVTGAHPATHRRPDRPRPLLSGSTESRPTNSFGVVQRRNDKSASCGPTDGIGPRGRR